MELIKCPVCGEDYSPSYPRCPFCEEDGARPGKRPRARRRIANRQKTQSARGGLIAVLIVVLALLSWYLFGDKLFPRAEEPVDPADVVEPADPAIGGDPFYEQPTDPAESADPVEPPVEIDVSNAQLNRDDFTLGRADDRFTIKLSGTEAVPTWVVDNPNVVTIEADGTVKAVADGSTTVHCKVGDRDLTCIVRVRGTGKTAASASEPLVVAGAAPTGPEEPAPTVETPAEPETPAVTEPPAAGNADVSKARLNVSDFTLKGKGTRYSIRLSGTEAKPTWSTDDPSVATVDENGTVTTVGNGKTTVHCKVGDRDLTCIVRVYGAG